MAVILLCFTSHILATDYYNLAVRAAQYEFFFLQSNYFLIILFNYSANCQI
jgi:hypothetical protein